MSDMSFFIRFNFKRAMVEVGKSAVIITSTAGPQVARSLCRDTRLDWAYSSLLLGVSLKYVGADIFITSLCRAKPPRTSPDHRSPSQPDWALGLSTVGFCLASIQPAAAKASYVTCWVRGLLPTSAKPLRAAPPHTH